MKRWIIASLISMMPLVLLSVANPIITLLTPSGIIKNVPLFLIYIIIVGICLAIIATTLISISHYTDKINNLKKEEELLRNKRHELEKIIQEYHNLITKR